MAFLPRQYITVSIQTDDYELLRRLAPERHSSGMSLGIHYQTVRRWQFPKERFVTYGPEDESWCRFFGIGEEVDVQEILELPNCHVTKVNEFSGSIEFIASNVTLERHVEGLSCEPLVYH